MTATQQTRTMTTSKGDTVVSHLTDAEAAVVLGRSSSTFGRDLGRRFGQGGRGWSVNQRPWAHKLALEVLEREAAAAQPQPAAVVLDLASLRAMMDRAGSRLKYPKIRFTLPDGPLCVARAGDASRAPGSITVTDGGRYGSNTFYGRVHTDGRWEPSRSSAPAWVEDALRELSADAVAFTGAYGRKTGNCCFCNRELSTAASLAVGYGPVCADNYGLPWGDVPAPESAPAAPAPATPAPSADPCAACYGAAPLSWCKGCGRQRPANAWSYATHPSHLPGDRKVVACVLTEDGEAWVCLSDGSMCMRMETAQPSEREWALDMLPRMVAHRANPNASGRV